METKKDLKKSDLRVQKTNKALYDALFTLLKHRNFNSITVQDLCASALVSRATFYSHFRDKYDVLDYLLSEISGDITKNIYVYDELEKEVNRFITTNKKFIINILKDANYETLALIRNFMSSIVAFIIKRKNTDEESSHHIILSNFFVGGLVNFLTWIVENDFPTEIMMINEYLYKMLQTIAIWDAMQEMP